MNAILTAIRQGQLPQAQPALVLSNLPEARGLAVARENFGVSTEILDNNELKGWKYRQKFNDAASKIRDISNKWPGLFGRFYEIIEPRIRPYLQK